MKTGGLICAAMCSKRRPFFDTLGSMTIPGLIFFTALMAVGGFAIDMQRLYGVHGQMQAFVDGAALAGAAELDGQTGAITRALRAACGTTCGASTGPLVTGKQSFAQGTATLSVRKVTFLSVLGTDPGPLAPTPAAGDTVLCKYDPDGSPPGWTPTGCDADATVSRNSKFVEVVAAPRTVSYLVLPVVDIIYKLVGSPTRIATQATLRLRATAGYKRKICDIHPMMICNPSEPVGNTNTALAYTPIVGQQILIKASGNGYWGPGDFGLLQVPNEAGGVCNGGGAGALTCILALVDPLTQCLDDQANVQPGQAETTSNGINVRFDIYAGSMNSKQGNPLFAPSVNVTKGLCDVNGMNCSTGCANPNQLEAPPSTFPSRPLPRDPNIQADTTGTVRFGNAFDSQGAINSQFQTAMNTYWTTNHGTSWPSDLPTNATRYQVYRYEINNNLIPNIANGESGAAACTTPGVNNPNRDRRLLTTAVINCRAANGGAGLQGMNNGSNLPIVAYLQMFLTEPIGLQINPATGAVTGFSGSVNDVYAEIAGVATPTNNNDIFHVFPVLYR